MPLLLLALIAQLAHADPTFYPRAFVDFEKALGGSIPFPPEKLARDLLALDKGSTLVSAIFPHGRSLERAVTDFHDPRSLLMWESGSASAPYLLYLGYTPKAEQLEVISWNWESRQFDFSLVSNYAPGKTPHVSRAYRPVCVACHQNGGPLFPGGPWNESTQNIDVLRRLQSESADSLSKFLLTLPLDANEPIRLDSSVADSQVREGTAVQQIQNICRDGCGSDLECREGLLVTALRETTYHGDSNYMSSTWRDKMRSGMRAAWPEGGFGLLNATLQDRDPDFTQPFRFSKAEDPLRWRAIENGHSAAEALYSNMMERYRKCWSFTLEQVAQLQKIGAAKFEAVMATDRGTALVKDWLPTEEQILAALSGSPAPARKISHVADEPVPPHAPGGLFLQYCAGCHMNSVNRPPNLPLTNLAELRGFVGSAERTVKDLLDPKHPLMPPPGAPQPSAEERAEMLNAME